MDEDEIEKWEENAKKGLLYRDGNVQRFLSDIRGVMSSAVDGMTLASMVSHLQEAGLTTASLKSMKASWITLLQHTATRLLISSLLKTVLLQDLKSPSTTLFPQSPRSMVTSHPSLV